MNSVICISQRIFPFGSNENLTLIVWLLMGRAQEGLWTWVWIWTILESQGPHLQECEVRALIPQCYVICACEKAVNTHCTMNRLNTKLNLFINETNS